MTSQAQARSPLPGVCSGPALGFRRMPPGSRRRRAPSTSSRCRCRCCFCKARATSSRPEAGRDGTAGLGSRATLRIVDQADHSFHVPARSGRTDREVLGELAAAIRDWIDALVT
jgi:hypothetical protein